MTAETRIERRIVVGHRMIGVVEDDGTEQRLIANFYQPQTTVAEARENARKFLAVDDLLEASQALLEAVVPLDPYGELMHEWTDLRTAILKARGES